MKFGVREICNVVFKAKSAQTIGTMKVQPGQPVLYIDTATTSTIEGAATTVYAQGGRGNTRLIAWEGEKTLTFTVEDALLSPVGMAMLTGAGLISNKGETVHFHMTSKATLGKGDGGKAIIDLYDALGPNEEIDKTAPIYVMEMKEDSISGMIDSKFKVETVTRNGSQKNAALEAEEYEGENCAVFVDFYVVKAGESVDEIQIDAENFAGYYYVEADTLFRRQDTGKDMPANITLPNVKIQSNFTFTMSSTGDPSTFTFTMDAFPGYTYFDNTKKVLCVIQTVHEDIASNANHKTVMGHDEIGERTKSAIGEPIGGSNASNGTSDFPEDMAENPVYTDSVENSSADFETYVADATADKFVDRYEKPVNGLVAKAPDTETDSDSTF